MHMSDALISPAVGGVMWGASAAVLAMSAKRLQRERDDRKVPLMGVLGAFVFAAQMINFSIPATGSSGHIGGGMILSILLGPHAAFITIASVLTVQALFFADGGLLALGCNIFNMGFFPCFVAYPFIYKRIAGRRPAQGRLFAASILSVVLGLQLGAFSVVSQTVFSGISELPFETFTLLMQPIHLAIGLVEGLITAAVVGFVWKARPEVLELAADDRPIGSLSIKKLLAGLAVATILVGAVLSWFASAHPDGLEWSMAKTSDKELQSPKTGAHAAGERIQSRMAFLPDYDFRGPAPAAEAESASVVNAGTSVAGLVGAVLTLGMISLLGMALRLRRSKNGSPVIE